MLVHSGDHDSGPFSHWLGAAELGHRWAALRESLVSRDQVRFRLREAHRDLGEAVTKAEADPSYECGDLNRRDHASAKGVRRIGLPRAAETQNRVGTSTNRSRCHDETQYLVDHGPSRHADVRERAAATPTQSLVPGTAIAGHVSLLTEGPDHGHGQRALHRR